MECSASSPSAYCVFPGPEDVRVEIPKHEGHCLRRQVVSQEPALCESAGWERTHSPPLPSLCSTPSAAFITIRLPITQALPLTIMDHENVATQQEGTRI